MADFGAGLTVRDFNDTPNNGICSRDAPKFRTVCNGINFRGKCTRCEENIVVPLGVLDGKDDVCNMALKCPRPECQSSDIDELKRGYIGDPTGVCIRNCSYQITGKVKVKTGAFKDYKADGMHTHSEASPWHAWDNADGTSVLQNYRVLHFNCTEV